MEKRNPAHCCGERKLVEFLTIEISIQISQNIRNKATIRSMNTTLGHMPKTYYNRDSHTCKLVAAVFLLGGGLLLEKRSYPPV